MEADKELREQLNVLIYEVTDSDDVVKQLADLLIPALIAWRDRAIKAARIDEFEHVVHISGEGYYRAVKLPNGDTEFTSAKIRLAELKEEGAV